MRTYAWRDLVGSERRVGICQGGDPPDDPPDDGIPFVGLTVAFGPLRTFGPLGTFGCFGTLGPFGTLGASVATLDAWPFWMLHTSGCSTLRDAHPLSLTSTAPSKAASTHSHPHSHSTATSHRHIHRQIHTHPHCNPRFLFDMVSNRWESRCDWPRAMHAAGLRCNSAVKERALGAAERVVR